MPRMPTWGGLRIGVDSIEPNTPPLVMVKVPPFRSSMASLPSRALAEVGDLLLDVGERHALGVAHHRHHQPWSVLTATPMS